MEQLRENIGSAQVTLSPEVLEAIESIHQEFTYPCP
jgi:aryl-alcohol dehydrogenase-like predicted oxidoreductase